MESYLKQYLPSRNNFRKIVLAETAIQSEEPKLGIGFPFTLINPVR
jgi:hypothetical protein